MRNSDAVFAVSVALEKKELIEGAFLIPSVEFNKSNFVALTATSEAYDRYSVGEEKIKENILSVVPK